MTDLEKRAHELALSFVSAGFVFPKPDHDDPYKAARLYYNEYSVAFDFFKNQIDQEHVR